MMELFLTYLGTVAFTGLMFGIAFTKEMPTEDEFPSLLAVSLIPAVNVFFAIVAMIFFTQRVKHDMEAA